MGEHGRKDLEDLGSSNSSQEKRGTGLTGLPETTGFEDTGPQSAKNSDP